MYIVKIISFFIVLLGSAHQAAFAQDFSWSETEALTYHSGSIYVVQNNSLYKVTLTSSGYNTPVALVASGQHANAWSNTAGMTSAGSSIIAVQNKNLYKVNPETGYWTKLLYNNKNDTWNNTAAMFNNYVVQGSNLYAVDYRDGSWVNLKCPDSGKWSNTSAITEMIYQNSNNGLYIVQNNNLYYSNYAGCYSLRDDGGAKNGFWNDVAGMESWNGKLYIVNGNKLYSVDPANGKATVLPGNSAEAWSNTKGMLVTTPNSGGMLYIVQKDNRNYSA
jgi:hypothetical protein